MESVTITSMHRTAFTLTDWARADLEATEARMADPQDLEDGLLIVAHEEAVARIMARLRPDTEALVFAALGVPTDLPTDLPG